MFWVGIPWVCCRYSLCAPGYRRHGSGTLYYVGNGGFSWASTVTGVDAHCLDFNYSRIVPNNLYSRAFGLQLRCLQE